MTGLLLGAALGHAAPASAELVDRVAAVVNNDVIPLSEVEQRVAPELVRVMRESDPQARAKARSQLIHAALDQMIGEKLLDVEMKDANLEVTEAQVEAGIEDVKKTNNLTDDQFKAAVQEQGFSMVMFRQNFRRQMQRLQLIRTKVQPKVKITEQDLRVEYQRAAKDSSQDYEVHVRHLVVAVLPKATSEEQEKAHQKARSLAEQARKPGVDFAVFAKKNSEGSSAQDGGDLGFFKRGTMEPAFDRAAFALKAGEISDPVRTKFGWHILKVEEKRNTGMKTFEELKPELQSKLQQAALERLTNQYIQQLRVAAVVDVKI